MNTLLAPLEYIVSWIMIGWHALLSPMFGADSGGGWALSIVGLVVVVRILLIPLFVRQIHSSRKMQLLQPQVREIQKKYEGDREKQAQALQALYKETKTNPFASCLPILLQAPVFLALFRTLNALGKNPPVGLGGFAGRPDLVESAHSATLFGAPLFATFRDAPNTNTKIVAGVLVLTMVVTTFTSTRQLMRKNMPQSALEGPFAQQQKIMMYVLPLMFLFSGYTFPIGVVLYWCISNIWSMGQQFYVIRRMPAPGSKAEEEYLKRQAGRELPAGSAGAGAAAGAGTVRWWQFWRRKPAADPSSSGTGTPPDARPTGDGKPGRGEARTAVDGERPTPNGSGPGATSPGQPPGRQQPKKTTRSQRRAGQTRRR